MSILNNQKNTIYVEDAKKLATAAGYKMRGTTDSSIVKPGPGRCILMDLSFLDNGDFNDPPQGGAYYSNLSFVEICNYNGNYEYYVQLYECKNVNPGCSESSCNCGDFSDRRGIRLINVNEFDNPDKKTKEFIDDNAIIDPLTYTSTYTCQPSGCNLDQVYSCQLISTTGCGTASGSTDWDPKTTNVLYDANDK